MNAGHSFTMSLLGIVCLLLLLLLLHMDTADAKKRRHRPQLRAAKTNKSVGVGAKTRDCDGNEHAVPPPPQAKRLMVNPWTWKGTSDDSFAFDHAVTFVPSAVEQNNNNTKTSSSSSSAINTETAPSMASSSTTAATAETPTALRLKSDDYADAIQQQQRTAQIGAETAGEQAEDKLQQHGIVKRPMPKSEIAPTTAAATSAQLQTEIWSQNPTEESAEIGKNQLKPCQKFTGTNGDTVAAPPMAANNNSVVNGHLDRGQNAAKQQQSAEVVPNVGFGPGTLPPGIEPSAPAFAATADEELVLDNNKLIVFDVPPPAAQPLTLISNDSSSSTVYLTTAEIGLRPPDSTSTTSDSSAREWNGTDSTKYWMFTRLPYIINATNVAETTTVPTIVPPLFNGKAREEEEPKPPHLDMEMKPSHLDLEIKTPQLDMESKSLHPDLNTKLTHPDLEMKPPHPGLEIKSPHADLELNPPQMDLESKPPQPGLESKLPQPDLDLKPPQPDLESKPPQPDLESKLPQPDLDLKPPQPDLESKPPQPDLESKLPQPDLELKPPHLGQGVDFFKPSKKNNASSTEKILQQKVPNSAGHGGNDQAECQQNVEDENADIAPVRTTAAESAAVPTVALFDETAVYTTVVPITPDESILSANDVLSGKKLPEFSASSSSTAPTEVLTLSNFDAVTNRHNKSLMGILDQQTKVADEQKQREDAFLHNALNSSVGSVKEENCCNLLRLFKGKRDNESEIAATIDADDGISADIFSVPELRDQKSATVPITDNNLEEANEEKLERGGTIKANWKVIDEEATLTTRGLEILLKEDLREQNFRKIQSHSVTVDTIVSSTALAPINLDKNGIGTTATTKAPHPNSSRSLPWTTTTELPAGTKKWTPYIFDCALETDERGESLCQEWAKGGLCDTNRATRFLFCRKTCLCIGILDSANE